MNTRDDFINQELDGNYFGGEENFLELVFDIGEKSGRIDFNETMGFHFTDKMYDEAGEDGSLLESEFSDWLQEALDAIPDYNADKCVLLVNCAHGQYIPQIFMEACDNWDVSEEDKTVLLAGPDHEYYAEVWDNVSPQASYTADDGTRYTLYINPDSGDLFAVTDKFIFDDSLEAYVHEQQEDVSSPCDMK